MYDRILVPLDGSEASEVALRFVRHLTCRSVRLLRVEPPIIGVEPAVRDRFAARVRHELEGVMGQLQELGKAGEIELEVRFGDASEEIIASAADADLVAMATHGRGAAGRLIFGSTADRVARHGTTPTLLIRHEVAEDGPITPNRVMVPLDGSELAEVALPEAEKLAMVLDAPILLVRAVGVDDVLATIRADRARAGDLTRASEGDDDYEAARLKTERTAAEYLDTTAAALRERGLTIATDVLKGTPAFVLLWKIEATDVVVMTTRGLGGYRRWLLGGVTEKLVREAAGPILLVRGKT